MKFGEIYSFTKHRSIRSTEKLTNCNTIKPEREKSLKRVRATSEAWKQTPDNFKMERIAFYVVI